QEEVNPWRCAVCQYPLSRAARFCVACGAPVAETCLVCGQVVPLRAAFCPGCGQRLVAGPPAASPPRPPASLTSSVAASERAPLAYTPMALAEKIRSSRAALEGERKHVTVLF